MCMSIASSVCVCVSLVGFFRWWGLEYFRVVLLEFRLGRFVS